MPISHPAAFHCDDLGEGRAHFGGPEKETSLGWNQIRTARAEVVF